MPSYNISLRVSGHDDGASSLMGRLSSALGSIGSIAAGILTAQVFAKIASGIADVGRTAVAEAANLQQFMIGLETLLAREALRASQVTTNATVFREASLNELVMRERLAEQIAAQESALLKLADAEGKGSLEYRKAAEDLQNLNNRFAALGFTQEGLIATTISSTTRTLDMADALELAGDKAGDVFNQIRALALVSPFEFSTVANTFRLQMAFGATAEEAVGLTGAILDTAAALGLSQEAADRLAYNFGQILSVGKITGVDLRQLRMVGLDLADVFENELSMSIEDVNAALEAGDLTMSQVSAAFMSYAENNFGGAAERMSRTFLGLKSSFRDLFTFVSLDVIGPALDVVAERFGGFFDKIRAEIEAGGLQELGGRVAAGVAGAFDILDRVASTIEFITTNIRQGSTGQSFWEVLGVPEGLIDNILDIQNAFRSVGDFLKEQGPGIGEAFGTFFEQLGGGLEGDFDFAGLLDTVTGAVESVAAFIEEQGPAITAFFTDNLPTAVAFLLTAWQVVKDVFAAIVETLTPVIEQALAYIESLGITWEDVGGIVTLVLEAIGGLILFVVGLIVGLVAAFIDAGRVGAEIWQGILDAFQFAIDGITQYLTGFIQFFVGLWTLLTSDVEKGWALLWAGVVNMFTGVISFIGGLAAGLVGLILQPLAIIATGVSSFVKNVVGFFVNLYNTLVGHSVIPDMMTAILQVVMTGLQTLIGLFRSKLGEIINSVKTFASQFFKAGAALIAGFIDGIESMVGQAIAAAMGVADDITGAVLDALGIQSPSKVFADIGKNLMLGLAEGVKGGLNVPVSAVVGASSALIDAAGTGSVTNNNQSLTINAEGGAALDEVALRRLLERWAALNV